MLMDAAVVVDEDGVIMAVHDMKDDGAEETMADLMSQGVELADFRGKLIMPGFVDGHAHAPQVKQCPGRYETAHISVGAVVIFSCFSKPLPSTVPDVCLTTDTDAWQIPVMTMGVGMVVTMMAHVRMLCAASVPISCAWRAARDTQCLAFDMLLMIKCLLRSCFNA